jgi:hypothetical protein
MSYGRYRYSSPFSDPSPRTNIQYSTKSSLPLSSLLRSSYPTTSLIRLCQLGKCELSSSSISPYLLLLVSRRKENPLHTARPFFLLLSLRSSIPSRRSHFVRALTSSRLNQNKSNASLSKLVLSHFSTLLHLIKSLPSTPSSVSKNDDEDAGGLLLMAVGESTKLLPWVMGGRKHVRAYLKVSLRAAARRMGPFRAIARRLKSLGDDWDR